MKHLSVNKLNILMAIQLTKHFVQILRTLTSKQAEDGSKSFSKKCNSLCT